MRTYQAQIKYCVHGGETLSRVLKWWGINVGLSPGHLKYTAYALLFEAHHPVPDQMLW